jgi:hypothetical protein
MSDLHFSAGALGDTLAELPSSLVYSRTGDLMTILPPEQRQAAVEAGDSPVEVADPQTGTTYVPMRADVYRRMRELLEADEDRHEHQAWARLARKARDEWARENSY